MLVFPTIFLSGAMYPVTDLPTWLAVLNRLNPLTYAVDPVRRLVFDHLDVVLTPHLMGLTRRATAATFADAARGITDVLAGRRPAAVAN